MIKDLILKTIFSIPFLFYTEKYPIPVQLDLQQVLFKENYILFVEDEVIKMYNYKTRSFLIPISKPLPSTVGIENNTLLLCTWTNFEINNPDEYSTEINIYGEDKKASKSVRFHETVKPSNCSLNSLSLETSMPQLQKKYFLYDFESEKLEEIASNKQSSDDWISPSTDIRISKEPGDIVWIYRKVPKF